MTINDEMVGYVDLGEDVMSLATPLLSGGRMLDSNEQTGMCLTNFQLTQPQTEASDTMLDIFANATGKYNTPFNIATIAVQGLIFDTESIARWYVSIMIIQNATGIYIDGYARHVCYNAKMTQAYYGPVIPFGTVYFTTAQYQGPNASPFTKIVQNDTCVTYSNAVPAFQIPNRRRLDSNTRQRELGISETDCLVNVTAEGGKNDTNSCPIMTFTALYNHTGSPNCHGEPHFVTWQGNRFDFHGECDLVYLHVPEFRGLGLSIHLRTLIRGEFSFVDVAALQIGSDILELGSRKGKYLLNGKLADPAKDNMIAGFPIKYSQDSTKKLPSVTLDVELGEGEIIRFRQLRNIVSVYIVGPKRDDFEAGVGLVGSFLTGSMLARDGKTVIADPNAFGQEWQVLDTDPQLFQVIRAPQYPQKCTMPSVVAEESRRRRLEAGLTDEEAQLACAGLSEDAYNDCMYDVIMSGDVRLAEAYVY